jgi:hypothetical protein
MTHRGKVNSFTRKALSLKTLKAGKPGATARTTIVKKTCRKSASMRTEDQKRLLSEQSFGDVS